MTTGAGRRTTQANGAAHEAVGLKAIEAGDREALLALLDRRRAELQQEVMRLGERFFQDRPRALARRLRGYWKAWRGAPGLQRPAEPLPSARA